MASIRIRFPFVEGPFWVLTLFFYGNIGNKLRARTPVHSGGQMEQMHVVRLQQLVDIGVLGAVVASNGNQYKCPTF